MWSAWSIFLLLWMGFALIMLQAPSDMKDAPSIQIQGPTFKQNCSIKKVKCVNDCSFLCIEKESRCVGGVCVTELDNLKCDTKKGGIAILAKEPASHWSCLCTDSSFWSGKKCNILNPDICEHGVFLYNGRDDFTCICPHPYQLITVNDRPHCVEKYVANFFREKIGKQISTCPAWRRDCMNN